ncbi:amino acid ABC transporter ATP-binding protein [Salipiger sp. P9]|uniref:amino acid ABC transporter ATP-binding protein n=1 Tax=Salipiger pentaromativorans TaxID=2943193 RepID=UPI002156FC1F|nr:amino acid ABC transporter ATP-binding protein [Salipiger pentaromativorans]MCR8550517.1 amino acid ABC transporter ATP-binding protein [Salipiger pentaromativorans]
MIHVKGLKKSFGDIHVLKGVDLKIERGDVAVVIGPSGCGKSTFLRCLNLLEEPTAGRLEIATQRLEFEPGGKVSEPRKAKFRASTGMVFQGFNLFPHMTVRENVMSGPFLNRILSRKAAGEKADELLARVGLSERAHLMPNQISGGQAQRVAIARALALDPEVMLFDEPTSALDPELVGEVLEVMQGLAEDGTTMVVVTHEMSFARDVATNVVFMDGGKVGEMGPPAQVLDAPQSPRLQSFLSKVVH